MKDIYDFEIDFTPMIIFLLICIALLSAISGIVVYMIKKKSVEKKLIVLLIIFAVDFVSSLAIFCSILDIRICLKKGKKETVVCDEIKIADVFEEGKFGELNAVFDCDGELITTSNGFSIEELKKLSNLSNAEITYVTYKGKLYILNISVQQNA